MKKGSKEEESLPRWWVPRSVGTSERNMVGV